MRKRPFWLRVPIGKGTPKWECALHFPKPENAPGLSYNELCFYPQYHLLLGRRFTLAPLSPQQRPCKQEVLISLPSVFSLTIVAVFFKHKHSSCSVGAPAFPKELQKVSATSEAIHSPSSTHDPILRNKICAGWNSWREGEGRQERGGSIQRGLPICQKWCVERTRGGGV